ncbi:hypothetical protein RJ639_008757, partial [Escallonia herrerae]
SVIHGFNVCRGPQSVLRDLNRKGVAFHFAPDNWREGERVECVTLAIGTCCFDELFVQKWLGFDCFWDLMRLRSPAMPPLDNMEKGVGKNQHSRLCLVSLLAAFFWFFLLYFHFVVLGGIRPKVDIRREPDVSVTPNFVNTQSSNPVVNADPKLEFSVDHSPVTAQPKPVSHSVTTPPTTPNVFR